ncbi:sporulation protein [Pirellulaceae bacterium]|nr:sporulation protein [Pirellulaceae bacterium]
MPIDRLILSITESGWSSILTTGLIVVVVIAIIAVFALKYAKGSVYLELPGSSYSGGDEIKGHIRVVPRKEIDAHNLCVTLQAELIWYEEERDSEGKLKETRHSETLFNDVVQISGDLNFVPGTEKSFPFQISIPTGFRNSITSMDQHRKRQEIKWGLRAKLSCKGLDLGDNQSLYIS